MSSKVKDIDIKNRTYYFFDDIKNKKNLDPNNIKIDEKSYKNLFICYTGYVTIKDSNYVKIDSLNPLTKSKYITPVSTNESKEKNKRYEELRSKTRDLIRSVTKNSNNYDKNVRKIKFDLDDELPLK